MPEPIRATLLIDPAALPSSAPADITARLDRIETQNAEILARLPAIDNRVLIDRAETARRLNISESTLDSWVRSGELVPVRVGSIIRFRTSELDAWAEERKRQEAATTE